MSEAKPTYDSQTWPRTSVLLRVDNNVYRARLHPDYVIGAADEINGMPQFGIVRRSGVGNTYSMLAAVDAGLLVRA